MKCKRNPVNKQGPRNLNCLYYDTCLDQAVRKGWPHWQCSECVYKSARELDDAVRTAQDANVCYELPLNLPGQTWQRY